MALSYQYARAIYDVRNAGEIEDASLIARVIAALKRRHHEKLLPAVLDAYKKIELEEKASAATIRLAHEGEKSHALLRAKELGLEEGRARVVIDPALIQGFVIEGKDFRYDASAKRSLTELYKKLIAA